MQSRASMWQSRKDSRLASLYSASLSRFKPFGGKSISIRFDTVLNLFVTVYRLLKRRAL